MGQISYEAYNKRREEREVTNNQGPRVGYFSLKNDGDEAIVRIMHDSTADFDMMVVHPTIVNGKRRNVNCLRSPEEPIANCPFCAAEKPIRSKIYIHLIEYTKDQTGKVIATPKLWERAATYVTTLKNLMDSYGPLSENIFKIKRNGAAGSMETTYDILYALPTVYTPDLYVKDTTLFENVKALGTAVLNRSAAQMEEMLAQETPAATVEQPVNTPQNTNQATFTAPAPQPYVEQPVHEPAPMPSMTQSAPQQAQNNEDFGEMVRPRRYY